jgi:hypothetical protein
MCCRRYPTKACGWSNPAVRSPWDNVASLLWSGDLFVKSGRDCQHHGGRELGSDGKANSCEPLINVVMKDKPKVLTGLDQNGTGPVLGLATPPPQRQRSPAKRRRPPHPFVTRVERGNPVALLSSIQDSSSQERPMGRRRKEGGKSQGRSVMERIGSAPSGNILPRESEQTSTRSLVTRELDQPIKEVSR